MAEAQTKQQFGSTVIVEVEDAVAIVTLNRPEKRNALNAEARRDLMGAFTALRDDARARVIVVTGAGEKAFAAGADIQELASRSTAQQRAFITPPHVYELVAKHPKPVIAMINGLALGAGCELAMACDVRVASATAKLGQPEINLGIIPGAGGTQRLPRLVGVGRASFMVLTGEIVDAATAKEWGLVDEVAPPEDLRRRTLEIARKMAEKSPVALKLAKEALRASEEMPLAQGLAREIDLFTLAFDSPEAKEGIAAFLSRAKER